MRRFTMLKAVILALAVSGAAIQPAQAAYIDPSTGGQLFQLLAVIFAFFSAIFLFFSSYIRMGIARIRRFTRGLFGHNAE